MVAEDKCAIRSGPGAMIGAVPLAALSTSDKIQLAIVIVGVVALMLTGVNVWLVAANERKRTQPIVIAHEQHRRGFSSRAGYWSVGAYVTNEGGGPAFNVRFGVEFHGVRYPYKFRVEDPDAGNVQRVIRPGEQRPPGAFWPILVDSTSLWSGNGDPDPGRVYWARYEDAQGRTWEARNPANRSAKLDIRRIRLVALREGREERGRKKSGQHGREFEREALAELREAMEEERKKDRKRAAEKAYDGADDEPGDEPEAQS